MVTSYNFMMTVEILSSLRLVTQHSRLLAWKSLSHTKTRLLVSASGGLYIARSGEHVATTIVPQVLQGRGFPELRLTPEVDRSARSLDSVLRIVEKTALWGRARLSGDLLSAMRQQSVRDALLAELFRLICGGELGQGRGRICLQWQI